MDAVTSSCIDILPAVASLWRQRYVNTGFTRVCSFSMAMHELRIALTRTSPICVHLLYCQARPAPIGHRLPYFIRHSVDNASLRLPREESIPFSSCLDKTRENQTLDFATKTQATRNYRNLDDRGQRVRSGATNLQDSVTRGDLEESEDPKVRSSVTQHHPLRRSKIRKR